MYRQTSVIEHNLFEKAVQKVNCSKPETIFPGRINVNNFIPFQVLLTTFVKYLLLFHTINKNCRNRLCFILIKDFLCKMEKKTKSKHLLCFVVETSKTLKVKILYSTKSFEKIVEINNETVKKKIQQLSYIKDCEKKADGCSIMAHSCSLGFSRFGRDPNLCSKSET